MDIKEIKYDEDRIRKDLRRQIQKAITGTFECGTKWTEYEIHDSLTTMPILKKRFFMWIIPYTEQITEGKLLMRLCMHIPFDKFGNHREHYVTYGIVDGLYGPIKHKAITTCEIYSQEILVNVKSVMNEFQKQFPEFPIEFYDCTGTGKRFVS